MRTNQLAWQLVGVVRKNKSAVRDTLERFKKYKIYTEKAGECEWFLTVVDVTLPRSLRGEPPSTEVRVEAARLLEENFRDRVMAKIGKGLL